MIKEGNIGLFETVCIVTIFLMDKMFYTSTSFVIYRLGTAAWYSAIISCTMSMVFFLIICILMNRFPGYNLIEISKAIMGKFMGSVIGLLFSLYFMFYTGLNLREFVDMIQSYNLPRTPSVVIIISILIIASSMAYFGLETIGRVCAVILIPVIFGMSIIFLMASPRYYTGNLSPYFGYGILRTLGFSFTRSSAYSEVIILFFIVNSIHGLKNAKKAGIISLAIAGTIFSITAMCCLMAFTYTAGSENISGLFELTRIIYLSIFIERVESIFLITWIVPTALDVTIGFYMSLSVYCNVFNMDNQRPMIFPFVLLNFIVAILPKNFSELLEIYLLVIRQYSFILNYCIPIFLLVASIVLKKGVRKSDVKKV